MDKKSHKITHKKFITVWVILIVILFVACIMVPVFSGPKESIQITMRDAVLHDVNRINLFGMLVNPSFISALVVSGAIIVAALIIRIFVIPRFKMVPGKFQLVLEQMVGLFSNMSAPSPKGSGFLGAYIFAAGVYIFFGTLFELFGFQVVATSGMPIALPAPLADINSAIMLGALSYCVIFGAAIAGNGGRGIFEGLKEITLLLSMSFRLFGALLSGLLVTELVYYFTSLSFVLPVLVGVMFTLLHALIQAYVLTMLTSMYYIEKIEPIPRKKKKKKVADSDKDNNSTEV